MLGVEALPALAFFTLLFFVPRSPRFLVRMGLIEEAKKVLTRVGANDIEAEIDEIKEGLQEGKTSSTNLFSKHYFKPITIAFLVAMFNQFSGINAILYYALRIFELTGLSSADSMFQPVIIGITNLIFTLVGMMMIDKVGRKKLLLVGSLGMSVCLGLISRIFYLQDFSGYGVFIYLLVTTQV